MRLSVLFAALCLSLSSTASSAQDIARHAQEAESLLSRGRVIEAIDALDEAAVALWTKAPLAFRRTIWVTEAAAGFGIYNERPNAVFSAGQPMLVYAEPVGFGWYKQSGSDVYRTDIFADVVFKSSDGKEIFRKDEFQRFGLAGRYRNREFMVNFTYTLRGISPGEYVVETTLRDQVTGKKGSFTLPFTIR
jgi:hypothetical protein